MTCPEGEITMASREAKANQQAEKALALVQHYLAGNDPRMLDTSIELYVKVLDVTPVDHPYRDRAALLSNLAIAYRLRSERTGSPADFDLAIHAAEGAVEATPPDHVERSNSLFNLAEMSMTRYDTLGNRTDLDRAYAATEEGIEHTDTDHPKWLPRLMTAARARRALYDRDDDLWALQQTVYAYEELVEGVEADHPYRTMLLANLGFNYMTMYERSGDHRYLGLAIRSFEPVIAATQGPERRQSLASIGLAYQRRHEHTGAVADLEQAQAAIEEAVAGASDGPERAVFMSNLGMLHSLWYERTGILSHLEQAIDAHEQSISDTPVHDPQRVGVLSNLSLAYLENYDRTGDIEDLRQAIAVGEMTIASAPDTHPFLTRFLLNLGAAYQRLHRDAGQPEDLAKAIAVYERAVAIDTQDIVDNAMAQSNLGISYLARHDLSGDPADLDLALAASSTAVTITPDDYPLRARYLRTLGDTCRSRLRTSGVRIDQAELRGLIGKVTATASPVDRVNALASFGILAHDMGEQVIATETLDAALALLPSLMPRESGWADQEHRLAGNVALVEESVAAHCAADDPVGALTAAESGRGVLLAARLDSRTGLSELTRADPVLAKQFQENRDRLNTAEGTDLRQHWADHDTLLAEIRRHPGFSRFLLPPQLADLRAATAGGAAVLVNASAHRGDAIIVTADADPRLVRLPDLSTTEVLAHTQLRDLPATLAWLRRTIVEPVLDALPGERVWWLPTGLLGLLPIHAAAVDHLVSSYIPTLRTLAHARSRPLATERRLLTVAMRHTPGMPELPGTAAEAAIPQARTLADGDATASQVLSALTESTWAHFACHASIDPVAPSRGGLHLHDGILPIAEISRLELRHAELAYLSACSTARTTARLSNESIHLASAFHLAGFRHVVASLWPLQDSVAATAAQEFYRKLPDTPTAGDAARVLHDVVKDLRCDHQGRPELWAALIHSGP
jgi:tetratricopeptide (TPR) repeat protein